MNRIFFTLLALILTAGGSHAAMPLSAIETGDSSAVTLPKGASTPDGMTVAKDGKIYLNVLNLQVPAVAAVWTLDSEDRLEKLIDLPPHPEAKGVYPLGIAQGADGNFYVADNQTFGSNMEYKSRLLRVVMRGGKAVRVETVATGLIAANAVEAFGARIYVTETCLIDGVEPHVSGVYKFELDELLADKPVQLDRDGADSRLVAKFTTEASDWRKGVGANGLAITPAGALYVCNFGEASILKGRLNNDGHLKGPLKVLVKGHGMGSTDGMKYVADWDMLIVADFFSNAVHLVSAKNGRVKTIAKNPNSTGAGGKLDKPSEPCVRGTTIYVSNIDLPYDGNEPDKPDTLSVIPVKVSADH